MKKESVNLILLGHHKDDIIENIFANVCRGRNILDLAVIKETAYIENVEIARPMIDLFKTDIYTFADDYQVPYFKDTTPDWSVRGKYRNNIYPTIEDAFTYNVKNNLLGLAKQSNEWNTLIQNQIIEPFMKEVNWKNDEKCYGVEFNIEKYNNYPASFWNIVFMKIFSYFNKKPPSNKGIITFMNSIKVKNVCYASISNNCVCRIKNYSVIINFKQH